MEDLNNIYKKYFKYTFLTNIFMVIIKFILFYLTNNYAFIIYSFYNLCIGLTKKNIFFNKKGTYNIVGILLLISSVLFINYSIYIIRFSYNVSYNLYMGLIISTVVFTEITLSIIGIIKSSKNKNLQNKILKLINLATSLISLELVQSSLLSYTTVGDNSLYNGIGGIIFGLSSFIISIYILKITNKK